MSKLNKYAKLLIAASAFAVFAGPVYARMADSIFGNEDEDKQRTAPIAKMKNPASSEQARYEFSDGKKIPSVELEHLLAAAERAAAAVIEEHNRRIDMMSMQETYIKNKHSTAIANKAKALLDAADACNAAQLSPLFSCSSQEYRPASVSLNGIRTEDRWSDYPKLCGASIWNKGLKPNLIGTYTEKLNDMKFQAGIWWGGAFEPTLSNSLFTAVDDETAEKLGAKIQQAWENLVKNDYVKKRAGTKGYVNNLPDSAFLLSTPPTSEEKWWNANYNPSSSEGGARSKIQEYNKQRWLLGYNYLMDIYHNWKYGTPVLSVRTNLWADQKTRYRLEIMENFFRYHESHYSGTSSKVDRPTMEDEEDWDSLGSTWPRKISSYQSKWSSIHSSENRYTCCKTCCDSEGKNCSCCPGEYKLIKDVTPPSKDSGARPREVQCPQQLQRGPDLTESMQPPPRPLILNNGRPSVMESVFIDAKISGDGYDRYQLYTGAVPDVWNDPFNAGSGYIEPKTASPREFNFEDFSGEYAQIADSPGTLANNSEFPFNQNRISAYLDIYEEYIRAKNNETKLTGPFGVNSKINSALREMLEQLKNRVDAGFYDLHGVKAADALSSKLTTSGNFDSPQEIETLYQESISRENWFYGQAKELLLKIGQELRKEDNRGVSDYERAFRTAIDNVEPEEPAAEGNGPRIPSSPDDSLFLYRVGRLYQTLAYFGTGSVISGQSSVYTPDVGKVQAAMEASNYNSSVINDFETKVERIRFDGGFEPPVQGTASEWLSGKAHTSRTIPAGLYKGKKIETVANGYVQIGPRAVVSDLVVGKTIADLEQGNIPELTKAFDEQREERFQKMDLVIASRENMANKQTSSFNGTDGDEDFIFSDRNFDTSTCLFKRRDSR